jgi:nucleotide-binding universal stress UspA family protein
MGQRILLATDGSRDAAAAGDLLASLPLRADSTIFVLTVVPDLPLLPGLPAARTAALMAETQLAAEVGVDEVLEEARRPLVDLQARVETLVRRGPASSEIVDAAAELAADWLVIGARGRSSILGFVLGGVSQEVSRYASCSVLVARGDARPPRRVLLAVDGSEHSLAAVRCVEWFPMPSEAELQVLSVVQPFDPLGGIRKPLDEPAAKGALAEIRRAEWAAATHVAAQARTTLAALGWQGDEPLVRAGHPAAEILRSAAEIQADLIVVGSRGLHGAKGYRLGSVSQKIVRYATVPVLVVKVPPVPPGAV